MARWEEVATRCHQWTRRLGTVVVMAVTIAATTGNAFALAATLPIDPSARFRRSLGLGYRFWANLSDQCAPLALGCLLVGWMLSRWDRAAGDTSRTTSHRLARRLNLASLVLAYFVPHYAALY